MQVEESIKRGGAAVDSGSNIPGVTETSPFITTRQIFDGPLPSLDPDIRRDHEASARLESLKRSLDISPEAESQRIVVGQTREQGAVIIIPGAKAEPGLLATTLRSIADQIEQGFSKPTGIIISDTGLTEDEKKAASQFAKSAGLSVQFADARSYAGTNQETAHARQAGIEAMKELAAQPRDDNRWRGDAVVFMREGVAMLPNALNVLHTTLVGKPDASGVSGSGRAVPSNLSLHYSVSSEQRLGEPSPSEEEILISAQRLPGAWHNGELDIASVFAFGRKNGFKEGLEVIRRRVAESLNIKAWPDGSFYDMACGICASRLGAIYRNPLAEYIEPDSDCRCKLRAFWGRDHVHALRDFAELNLVNPGIHVLEPEHVQGRGYVWHQWTLPCEGTTGVVIHPKEIEVLLERHLPEVASKASALLCSEADLAAAMASTRTILSAIKDSREDLRHRAERRDDLPYLWPKSPDHKRGGDCNTTHRPQLPKPRRNAKSARY